MLGKNFKGKEELAHIWGWARDSNKYQHEIQGCETCITDFPTWKFTFQSSAQFTLCANRLGSSTVQEKGSVWGLNYASKTRSQIPFPPLLWLLSYL